VLEIRVDPVPRGVPMGVGIGTSNVAVSYAPIDGDRILKGRLRWLAASDFRYPRQ
jgi:hypothetical protein